MQVLVKTEIFEGPFDLLYHLIEKNEIDIHDIPIALITEQYIEYLNSMPERDMDSMSEFVLMAAELLEIKSKLLLPKQPAEEGDGTDPREELVRKLIEYKRFREISEVFRERDGLSGFCYRQFDATVSLPEVSAPSVSEVMDGIGLDVLFSSFGEVLKRRERKVDRIRSGFGSVRKDTYTVAQKIGHIMNLLTAKKTVRFSRIFGPEPDRSEMVVTFLALLELIRMKRITASQSGLFGEIIIRQRTAGK